jgi:hypothetical protein
MGLGPSCIDLAITLFITIIYRSRNQSNFSEEFRTMSAPSRRPEIRRRRTRAEKITKLRKRLVQASNAQDKSRLEGKLNKLGLASPGHSLLQKG